MKNDPIITKIEVHEFEWQLQDVGYRVRASTGLAA